jgi:predicted  nucleic acid-binding Zn-ribbon protein
MPHQCIACGRVYDDGAAQVLHGCACTGKVFFYIKGERSPNEIPFILTTTEDEESPPQPLNLQHHEIPVLLDVEAVHVVRDGTTEIDVVNLMRDKASIYKIEDGKYYIDIEETLEQKDKKKENNKK